MLGRDDALLNYIWNWVESSKTRRLAAYNLSNLLYMVTSGPLADFKKDPINRIDNAVEILLKESEFKSTIFPTIVSWDKGRNFWISGYKPEKHEKLWSLYMILTGISLVGRGGTILVNIDGLNYDERARLISHLIFITGSMDEVKPTALWDRISKNTYGRFIPYWSDGGPLPNIYAFAFLGQFSRWIYYKMGYRPEDLIRRRLDLITIVAGRNILNQFIIFPSISRFIVKWFEDLIGSEEPESTNIGRFIASFYDPGDFKEKTLNTINKFLYYFLNGYVSGDLLNTMITDKISLFIRSRKGGRGRVDIIGGAGYFYDRI